jgi:hypothetical protein
MCLFLESNKKRSINFEMLIQRGEINRQEARSLKDIIGEI